MNISLILGHPASDTFNHAIARAAHDALLATGHQVWFHDLQAEGFDPCFTAPELQRDAALPSLVARHVEEVCAADGLIVHQTIGAAAGHRVRLGRPCPPCRTRVPVCS
jgi:putative NADPH-quinone reductase